MSFKDWLASVEKEQEQAKPDAPAEGQPAPEQAGEPDPLGHLIGKAGGLGDQSPFDAFLDSVEAEKPADFVPTVKASEHHDWQIKRQAVYSEDHVVWECSKCCRTVSVERDQTVKAALDRIGVKEDCSMQVASEVMDT